jgi:hypothetical protein
MSDTYEQMAEVQYFVSGRNAFRNIESRIF